MTSRPRPQPRPVPIGDGNRLRIEQLGLEDLSLLGEIDRSEHQQFRYSVAGDQLISRRFDFEVPGWDPVGHGDHSVTGIVSFAQPIVARGADFLGAFLADEPAGLVILDTKFEAGLSWLALLYVDRVHRRGGVASMLWSATLRRSRAAGAAAVYVSAIPSDSAVGFYLSRGCHLATRSEINDGLYELEPDDIHLIYDLS